MKTILFQLPSREKTYNLEEHLYFWENTCWILVNPRPPRKIRKSTPQGIMHEAGGPRLMELRSNDQHSMPDGHCRFL